MDNLIRFDKDSLFVLVDFETYNINLNFNHNVVWQTGLLKVRNNEIIDSKDILIKWPTKLKISSEAAFITRYSQEKVDRLGIPPEKAFEVIYSWLNEAKWIIGHNLLNFDLYLLKEWCLLYNKPWKHFPAKILDTNAIAKGIGLGMPYRPEDNFLEYQYKMLNEVKKGLKTNLTALGKQHKIEFDFESLHDGFNDVLLNKKIFDILKFNLEL